MESPERNESIPTPVDQGSPFFKYLCGLSPIKPARSVHVVQTYAELSLPPPPAVFTSPPNAERCGGRAKRGLVVSRTSSTHVTVESVGILGNAWGGDKENQPNHSYIPKSYLAAQADTSYASSHVASEYVQQHALYHKGKQEQAPEATGDTPTKFEYGDVADYLADPAEGEMYAEASSELVGKSYMHKSPSPPDDFRFPKDDHHNFEAINDESLSSEHQDRSNCRDDATNAAERDLDTTLRTSENENHQLGDILRTDRRESLASRSSGSSSDHEGCGNGEALKAARLDQESAAMGYLLAGDVDGEGVSRNEWAASHSALSEFSRHQEPEFSAIARLSNLAQLRTHEDFELAASKALENQRNVSADMRDRELEDRKDVLVGAGQRGVRRRCLDFETSVRRKSMGGVGSRKTLSLRSKTQPESLAMTSASSIPPSILCERAVATSDATNSAAATSAALDAQSEVSLRPECTPSDSEVLSPGLLRVSRCSVQGSTDLISTDQSTTDPTRLVRDSGNSSSYIGIPSGIGLHLNSLTGSISFSPTNREFKQAMGITSANKGAVASLLRMPGMSGATQDNRSENLGNSMVGVGNKNFSLGSSTSFSSGVMFSVMERSRLTLRESLPVTDAAKGVVKPNTLQSLTVGRRQSLEGCRSARANVLDKKFGSGGRKRLPHQDIVQQPPNMDFVDEYDSPRSPKKRRKSPTASGEKSGAGCKRCNCKKSKCLKLYCECFAAGTYCVDSCTCHDCYNKPEHGETVRSTRQQIESRNPLAFAPKIIHSGEASPKRGEEIIETPASARHKRGCNCKKSLCLKKYCECYQAGVGCSEGCRCEGCKNMYGRKEVTEDSDDKETASDALESGSPEDELELKRPGCHVGAGSIDQNRNNGKDLSPITPSFQYTGQGRTIGRVRSAGKKRLSSPLSQSQSLPNPARSPVNVTRSLMKFQSNKNADQTPDLQQLRGENSPISTPKLSRVNQLSPRWDGLGDICTLTPLAQPPLRPTPASLSTLDRTGASPSFSHQSIEPISSYQPDKFDSISKGSPPRFQQASGHSPLSSLGGRISQKTSYLGNDNSKAGVTQSGQQSSFLCEDDDTPDFLKYADSINSPVITKTSSPKQKRVSPPHFEGMRDRNRGDGRMAFDSPARSSPGLRSGRKFILQALPSLPPLMPMANSSLGQAGNCLKQD